MGLKGTAWDWIYAPATGQYAAAPSWSHDGTKVLFTMTNVGKSGRLGSGTAHLYTVPYSKAGPQVATPVPGDGSLASRAQYYGTYSGDDKLIAYNELDAITASRTHPKLDSTDTEDPDGMYAQPQTEIYVINANGGNKVRFAANDPAACPGVPTQPRHQQQLAEVVAAGRDLGQPHVLLGHLLVVARGQEIPDGRADRAAVSDGGDDRRDLDGRELSRHPHLEPAGQPEQPHAGLGYLPDTRRNVVNRPHVAAPFQNESCSCYGGLLTVPLTPHEKV